MVAAAAETPFEAARRVFVLERVDTMNDEVANRLLKTLEEPARFVHLILLTDALGQVIQTVVSRCQLVRFDPLPAERIAAELERVGRRRPARAAACGRLALGNARARHAGWPRTEGEALRATSTGCWPRPSPAARDADAPEPWRGLLDRAEERRDGGGGARGSASATRASRASPRAASAARSSASFEEAAKREGRRARTEVLDLGLTLAALGFRDLVCIAEGADVAALDPERARGAGAAARSAATRAVCARRPSAARTLGCRSRSTSPRTWRWRRSATDWPALVGSG